VKRKRFDAVKTIHTKIWSPSTVSMVKRKRFDAVKTIQKKAF